MNGTLESALEQEGLILDINPERSTSSISEHTSIIPAHLAEAAASLLLPNRVMPHHPKAGVNPLVDAAGYLFSVIGKLRTLSSYRQLNKLQKELIQEINTFDSSIKTQGYQTEYLVVCRYVLCATIDDIICNTGWGGQGQWESYNLLTAFGQDLQHQDKFFTILERALKEPAHYIDIMELMYICLSMGYKGSYRATEHSQYQLEQITNNLYKHIRAYRGSFSKALSPAPLKSTKPTTSKIIRKPAISPLILLCITASIVMIIFIGLSYLMDIISNEAFKNMATIEKPATHDISRQ